MKKNEIRGMSLSQMTLGTVQLGLNYGMNNQSGKPGSEEAGLIIGAAAQAGVNCLDTARLYGDSEEVIGAHRGKYPDMKIVSKFKLSRAQGTDAASVRRQIEDSVSASLKALRTDKIDILLLHESQDDDLIHLGNKIAPVLADLRQRGLIAHAGVSVYEGYQIDAMLENALYEAVQIPINVLDQRLLHSGHLERLHRAGCMVFARSVFLQGLLLMENPPKALCTAAPFLKILWDMAAEENRSVAELAVCFVRDLPGITSLVIGAERAEQVRENGVLMEKPPLSARLTERLCDLARSVPIEEIMRAVIEIGKKYK